MKAAYIGIDLLFPALPALVEHGCEIVKIFSCRTDNVTEFNTQICGYAHKHGISLQLDRIRTEDIEALKEQNCELILCGGYYYRVPVLEGIYMVNIHPSLLPVGRGSWPMPVTILKGLRESGVTLHKMTEKLDAGDILLQEKISVDETENLQTLSEKQKALLPAMAGRLCRELPQLWADAVAQDEGKSSYWPMLTQEDWTVKDGMNPELADRILRAFYGYEVVYEQAGSRWELIDARLTERPERGKACFPFADRFLCADRVRRMTAR